MYLPSDCRHRGRIRGRRWAIKHELGNPYICYDTFAFTRKDAIGSMVRSFYSPERVQADGVSTLWKLLKQQYGFHVIQVKVTELKKTFKEGWH